MNRGLRRAGLFLLGVGAAGALTALVLRDQLLRHRRNLFSPNAFRRLAALGHLAGEPGTVDAVTLLRDFTAWEPRSMLRRQAAAILTRMEEELQKRVERV